MSFYKELDFDDPSIPKLDTRSIAERRKEAVRLAEAYEDTYWTERAKWTDEQWLEEDARVNELMRIEQERKEQEDRVKHRRKLVGNGWPQRAIDAADQADQTLAAIKHVTEWDRKAANVLTLSGPPGCGKTTAAAFLALQEMRFVTTFVRASTFARASRYGTDRDDWLGAAALVLDDLGSEFGDAKGSFQTDLDELIDTFYGNRRPLIITTNVTSADFKKRYGERVVDRLRECGKWFEIRGASMRGKKS